MESTHFKCFKTMTCQLFCQALMKSSAPAYAFFTRCCLGWIVYFEHILNTIQYSKHPCSWANMQEMGLNNTTAIKESCHLYTHSFHKDTHIQTLYLYTMWVISLEIPSVKCISTLRIWHYVDNPSHSSFTARDLF